MIIIVYYFHFFEYCIQFLLYAYWKATEFHSVHFLIQYFYFVYIYLLIYLLESRPIGKQYKYHEQSSHRLPWVRGGARATCEACQQSIGRRRVRRGRLFPWKRPLVCSPLVFYLRFLFPIQIRDILFFLQIIVKDIRLLSFEQLQSSTGIVYFLKSYDQTT